jgi:hypothetical protein
MRGDHCETRDVHPWVRKDDAVKLDPGGLSARWTGFLEAWVSEDFTFTLYTYGQGNAGAKVRLWVDGTLIADAWDGVEPKQVGGYVYTRAVTSRSIRLTA